jgi:hypothetical protein
MKSGLFKAFLAAAMSANDPFRTSAGITDRRLRLTMGRAIFVPEWRCSTGVS